MIKLQSLFINRVIYIFILITCFFGSKIVIAKEENSSNTLCQVIPKIDRSEIISQNTISETGLTIPSLWWRKQQIDPKGAIVINWKAYTNEKIIDLIVDRQRWNFIDYIKRYNIVNDFGTVAREYKYNLRIINDRQTCLGTYTCDFNKNFDRCKIDFKSFNGSVFNN